MNSTRYDIGIIGSLCSCDMVTAVKLANAGLKTVVFCKEGCGRTDMSQSLPSSIEENLHTIETVTFKPGLDFYKKARQCKLILSFSASILGGLRELFPLKFMPSFPPVVNVATGSDITEFMNEQSIAARLFRFHLKTSPLNWMVEYPLALKFIQKYNLPNVQFMPFPGIAPDTFHPLPQGKKLRILAPSRIDWRINDPGEWRCSSNGNDRFIRAFARAVKSGLNAECTMLFRGPDRHEAKKLVEDLGISDNFIWKNELTRDQLLDEIREHHVIADQFDTGGIGGIAIEAMSIGRPVIIYLNHETGSVLYRGDLPPVLACHSEDEIFSQIMTLKNDHDLQELSEKSRNWVMKYYSGDESLATFLYQYFMLTGHRVKDYGWEFYKTS